MNGPQTTTDINRPARRRRHVGKLVFVVVLLLMIAAGIVFCLPRFREQAIIGEIRSSGGSVEFTQTDHPTWLRDMLGDKRMEFFEDADYAVFENRPVSGAMLSRLGELRRLGNLALQKVSLPPDGLARICKLTSLKLLDF